MVRRSFTGLTVAALLVVGGVGAAWWYLEDRQAAAPANAQPVAALSPDDGSRAVFVDAIPARNGTVVRAIGAVGSLRSNESVIVRPEIAGRIAEIHFAEGERVKKGAPLVSLDASVYQAELAQAEARLELARANAVRARELYQRRVATERTRDEAQAELRAREAEVALARARLDKMWIAAPFDGVLGLRRVSVGDYVNPGQELVNLESIEIIKVDFRVPEPSLSLLRDGQAIEVKVDAFPDDTFVGTVYAIDPLIDIEGRSVVIRARVRNEERRLRPGLFARVSLIVERRDDAILVPEQAIVPLEGGAAVFRVIDGRAVLTPVTLGQRRAGEVEIVGGLRAGEPVITAGQLKLRDATPVRVREQPEKASG